MKKLSVLILVAVALFAGCNNLTVEKDKDSKSGNVTINIANQSRTISPMSGYSLSDFEEWEITFKDQSGFIDDIPMTATKDNLVFTVPAGIYTVVAKGSYTPVSGEGISGEELTLTGTKTDVEIGDYAEVNISVGLAKETTGDFSYTLSGIVSGFVSLVNMKTGGQNYSAQIQEEETSDESALKAVVDADNKKVLVTGTGLVSGFYKLYVTDTEIIGAENTDAVIYYDIGDFLVEIADDLTTTGSASSVSSSQIQAVYYGTNDTETGYNGKFPFARKNVNDILKLLIDNKKWQNATIYMEEVPELDVVVINQLREAMTKGDRSESLDSCYSAEIIDQSSNYLIGIYAQRKGESNDSQVTWTSTLSVQNATELSLNANSADESTDESEKELVIDSFETREVYVTSLILEDGVTVVTSSLYGINQKELTVNLDDYNTYEKTPFLVYSDVASIPEMSIVFANGSYVAAQKTISDDEQGPYTISWYARVACPNEPVVNEAIPAFSITAEVENVTITGGTIPVAAGSTIKFSISSEELDESYAYTWYFTGDSKTLLSIDSVYQFAPTTAEDFNFTDGQTITLACVVSDGAGNWRSEVYEFVLTAAQSPIILYNNQMYDTRDGTDLTLGLAAFDEIEPGQAISSFLHEGETTDFCFDGNCNLYAVTVKKDEVTSTTTSTISKYAYSLLKGYSPDSTQTVQSKVNAISCDTTNGYLFAGSGAQITVFIPGEGGYTIYTLDVPVDEITADGSIFSETDGITYSYETEITDIAVSKPALYIAMDVIQTGEEEPKTARIIARYTYSTPEGSGGSITLTRNSHVAVGVGEFTVFEDVSDYPLTVNDMMVQDSKLYVLVSQQEGSNDKLRHRGALLTITDDNGSLSLTSTYGANTAAYATSKLGADTFYAPQKFLAVMPKKLVIADEGYYIEDYNVFEVDQEAVFINRVVTVDLDDPSESTYVNVNVSFDLDVSISGTKPDSYMNYRER